MPIFENKISDNESNSLKEWRKKSEKKETSLNRFNFMNYSDRLDQSWIYKRDPSTFVIQEVFTIKIDKFVNRPDTIAYNFYNDTSLWWIIALANDIQDPLNEFYMGRKLKIPDLTKFKFMVNS